ncbi:hypothetical protein BDW75DRAFT_70176 [Aspergillus navahoensis]
MWIAGLETLEDGRGSRDSTIPRPPVSPPRLAGSSHCRRLKWLCSVGEHAGRGTQHAFVHQSRPEAETDGEREREREGKLWYYGLSYGTVLGATFAHFFPDRIERMILDRFVDAEDYLLSLRWRSNLYNADKAPLDSFTESCLQARGKESCAFCGPSAPNIRPPRPEIQPNPHFSLRYHLSLAMLAAYSVLKQLILQAMYPSRRVPKSCNHCGWFGPRQHDCLGRRSASGAISTNPCNCASSTVTTDINTLDQMRQRFRLHRPAVPEHKPV